MRIERKEQRKLTEFKIRLIWNLEKDATEARMKWDFKDVFLRKFALSAGTHFFAAFAL